MGKTKETFKAWFGRVMVAVIPLLLVAGMLLIYSFYADRYLYCKNGGMGCKPVDIMNVLQVDKNYWTNDAGALLREKQDLVADAGKHLNENSKAIESVEQQLGDETKTVDERKKLEKERAGLLKEAERIGKEKERLSKELNETRSHIVKRYTGRMSWLFLRAVYLILSTLSMALAACIVYAMFVNKDESATLWTIEAVTVSVSFGLLLYTHPDAYMPVFKTLFENSLRYDLENMFSVTNFINSYGFAGSFSLVVATVAILLPSHNPYPKGLAQLSRRMDYLRWVLYAGTLMLIAGILLIKSICHWSLAFIVQEDQAANLAESFYASMVSLQGGFYTLILAAVYLPSAFILQRRARALKFPSEEQAKKEELLKSAGFTFDFMESVPRLLAILGPLLVGPIAELFTRISK